MVQLLAGVLVLACVVNRRVELEPIPAATARRVGVAISPLKASMTTSVAIVALKPNLRVSWKRTFDLYEEAFLENELVVKKCVHGGEVWTKLGRETGPLGAIEVRCVAPRVGPVSASLTRADGREIWMDQPSVHGFEGTDDAVGVE